MKKIRIVAFKKGNTMSSTNAFQKNCKFYQIYYYAKKSLLLFYIVTLYYLALGLSYTNIAIISVIGTLSTLLSEIPTGTISDTWSRKRSLQISEILKVASILMRLMGGHLLILCIASFIWGIADSCQSGSDQALLYELFDDEKSYNGFLSKLYSRSYLASALATLTATTLFSINIYLPLIISIILDVVALIAISMVEEKHNKVDKTPHLFVQTNKNALIYIIKKPCLANLMIMMSICMNAIMFINSYTQPLLVTKGVKIVFLGPLMFVFNLLMSWGAKLQKRLLYKWAHYVIAILIGFCAIIMGIASPIFCVVTIACYRILNGMIFPQIISASNKLLEDNIRATVMSFQSMMTSLLSIGIDPIIGFGLDRWGISRFYKYWGSIYTSLVIIIWIISKKSKAFKT